MNSQIETETEFNTNISFKDANGDSHSNITGARYTEPGEPPDGAYGISFDGSYVYNTSGSITGWHNEAYRTITFLEAPTGDLLTWLQANGTKQGGTTAHTLTWSDSTMTVTVNGNAVTSPHTLANGDEISLKRTSGYQSYNIITNTGSFDTDSTSSPLAVSNSDIKLQNGNVDTSPSMIRGFTINYTE